MAGSTDKISRIRGCLIGGAVGDALGYPVEFLRENQIWNLYGKRGITEYTIDALRKKAIISDDTQMTLFTANGILVSETERRMNGSLIPMPDYVKCAYQDWLITQNEDYDRYVSTGRAYRVSWLCDVPELHSRRAPGMTCLSALAQRTRTGFTGDYIHNVINDSKGCGGVMRVAPLGLYYNTDIKKIDMEGAQIAAITHTHPLGYIPAAVLVHIVNRSVYAPEMTLNEIVSDARDTVVKLFGDQDKVYDLAELIDLSAELSQNDDTDINNIHTLGGGWTGEEAIAIAIYCSLKYQGDFSNGIIAAVNHDGDSDSTGAITGNILGAYLGHEAIDSKWTDELEILDVIEEISADLDCGYKADSTWQKKYLCKYKEEGVDTQ